VSSVARPAIGGSRPRRHRFDVLAELAHRDLRLRYRGSLLGLGWAQLAPLAQLAVMTVVFTRVVPVDVEHYPAFLLVGLLAWQWWSSSLTAATSSVVASRDLLHRPGFAADLLPPIAIASQALVFAVALPVALVVAVVSTGRLPVTVLSLPAIVAVQALVLAGPAWLLAAAQVRWRDVGQLVSVALVPLFYATPVLYPTAHVHGRLRAVLRLNPAAHLVEAYRDALLDGTWPSPTALALLAVLGAALAVAARAAFERALPSLVDQL
jgi:ABC-type polysaccharide/polyol phosphate export permease